MTLPGTVVVNETVDEQMEPKTKKIIALIVAVVIAAGIALFNIFGG